MAKILFMVLVTIVHGGELFKAGETIEQGKIPDEILKNLESRKLIKKLSPLPENVTNGDSKKPEKIPENPQSDESNEKKPEDLKPENPDEDPADLETGFENPLDSLEKKNNKKKGK